MLGWALTQSGEFAAAEAILDAVVARAAARCERGIELRGLVERMEIVNIVRPEGAAAETFKLGEDVVPELEARGDDRGLAHAWRVIAYPHNTLCRYGAAVDALERGLVHAERAGEAALRSEMLAWLPRLVRGPMPAQPALGRCRELLAQAAGDRQAKAGALAGIALPEAISGRLDEARAAERQSRAIKEELGLRFMLALGDIWRGELELLDGDLSTAEDAFRAAADFLGERGERNFYPTAAVGLARVFFHQRRYDESWEELRAAETTMASDDLITGSGGSGRVGDSWPRMGVSTRRRRLLGEESGWRSRPTTSTCRPTRSSSSQRSWTGRKRGPRSRMPSGWPSARATPWSPVRRARG